MTASRPATVSIQPIAPDDAADILTFELENRAYFARSIPDRGDDYYDLESLAKTVQEVAEDFENGVRYMHLVRDAAGELVGRVNLFDVQRDPAHSAELGYRIAERHTGKGYATAAVGLTAAAAFRVHGLHRLEAATSPENVASQVVLLRNGFQFWGRARSSYHFNGAWVDSLHFEKIHDAETASLP